MSMKINTRIPAVFLSVFGKLPVPSHLGKNEDFFIIFGKNYTK